MGGFAPSNGVFGRLSGATNVWFYGASLHTTGTFERAWFPAKVLLVGLKFFHLFIFLPYHRSWRQPTGAYTTGVFSSRQHWNILCEQDLRKLDSLGYPPLRERAFLLCFYITTTTYYIHIIYISTSTSIYVLYLLSTNLNPASFSNTNFVVLGFRHCSTKTSQ